VKGLVIGILAVFAALLAISVHIAEKMYDGTVEENYYQKSLAAFRDGERAGGRPPSGPFVAFAGSQKVLLDIAPIPVKAMKELSFSVELPGYGAAGILWLDLGMPGMRMPPNRVDLVKEGDGRYRGKGVLVKCTGGTRTWTATVSLPGKGTALFTFDVAD
jgi:hypothetical protein